MTHFEQMRAPERDQTETQAALKEFQTFFDRYPMSPLMEEVRMKWREARDRLSRAEFRVGFHYFRIKWYPGAIPRFRHLLEEDPMFGGRDEVYFYLAESLARTDKKPEAIPVLRACAHGVRFQRAHGRSEAAPRRTEDSNSGSVVADVKGSALKVGGTDDVENVCSRNAGGCSGRHHTDRPAWPGRRGRKFAR